MTIVLDQPWQIALLVTVCLVATVTIVRDFIRSIRKPDGE